MDQYKALVKAWVQMFKRKHSKGSELSQSLSKKGEPALRNEKSKLTIAFRASKQTMVENFIL